MADIRTDRRRQRVALILLPILLIALVGAVALGTRGSGGSPQAAAPPGAAPAEQVLLVPVGTAVDPFTEPVGTDLAVPPLAATGSTGLVDVEGDAVGLFGGEPGTSPVDRTGLIEALAADPGKASTWAGIKGLTPQQLPDYITGLTPAVLRADTLVTAHGYVGGKDSPFAAILQAGSAVLVDGTGVPAVHAASGSPLTAAPNVSSSTKVDGSPWPGFSMGTTVRVQPADTKVAGFSMVNIKRDTLFTRPVGTSGKRDNDTREPAPPGIAGTPATMAGGAAIVAAPPDTAGTGTSGTPDGTGVDAAAPTPGSTERPPGDPVTLFEIGSIAGVSSGPTKPSVFTLDTAAYITAIMDYHYLNQGRPPGTIGLQADDGTMYGPWQATGGEGQGGVANAYWNTTPNVVIPAGTYTVIDSDPSAWSWALDTQQRGMSRIDGIPITTPVAPVSPSTPSPSTASTSAATAPSGPVPPGPVRPARGQTAYELAFMRDTPPEGAPNGGPGTPDRPTMVAAEAVWDQTRPGGRIDLNVYWSPPADTGDSPITGYLVCLLSDNFDTELVEATCGESDGTDTAAALSWRDEVFANDPPLRLYVSVMAVNASGMSLLAKPAIVVDIGCDVYGLETGPQNPYGTLCRHSP